MKSGKLKDRYGEWAIVAGASEGLGAEFARQLAKEGFNLVLIARREGALQQLADELRNNVEVRILPADLSDSNIYQHIFNETSGIDVGILVYNAVTPLIGHFIDRPLEKHEELIKVNVQSVMQLTYHFSKKMVSRGRGAILLMSSMAGQQGSAMVAHYAASKAYNTVLAEGLWYELKNKNVDVMAVIAGAISTPNYINSNPKKTSMGTPPPLKASQVVREALQRIGSGPSFITGRSNRVASWFMRKLFSRKKAVEIISKSTTEMYPHYREQKKDPD